VRIGLLCGSFGSESSNLAALNVAAAYAATNGLQPVMIDGLVNLPAFIVDELGTAPASVRHFRDALVNVDALIIAVPEYAAGMAGSTKNALDWLVGEATLYRKPIAVISAGTTGGERAIEQLTFTLSWAGAWVFSTLGIESPRTKMTNGSFADEPTIQTIEHLVDRLVSAASGDEAFRHSMLKEVVEPFGIDVARFGNLTG